MDFGAVKTMLFVTAILYMLLDLIGVIDYVKNRLEARKCPD